MADQQKTEEQRREHNEKAAAEVRALAAAIPAAAAPKRLPFLQIIMLVNIGIFCLAVTVVLALQPWKPRTASAEQVHLQEQASSQPASEASPGLKASTQLAAQEPAAPAISWKQAEQEFQARKLPIALNHFQQLQQLSEADAAASLNSDLLRLRIGQCLLAMKQSDSARQMLSQAGRSPSPAVAATACYELAADDYARGQFLYARMHAYQAIAVVSALAEPFAKELEATCDLLVARSLTHQVLNCYNRQLELESQKISPPDAFSGLEDNSLDKMLKEGSSLRAKAALAPSVTKESTAYGDRFTALSSQACVDEFLQRLSRESASDVCWQDVASEARNRPLRLSVVSANFQRLTEIACGSAGLVARFTGDKTIIQDTVSYSSTDQQRQLLKDEAVSFWRRLLLRTRQSEQVAEGHFSLGLIFDCSGESDAAMREYQLVASRFTRQQMAPQALLRAAKLQIRSNNVVAARENLQELQNICPDFEKMDEVYLNLADVSLALSRFEEAANDYRKLYFMNLSPQSAHYAALGMARCSFAQGNYSETCTWLDRCDQHTSNDPLVQAECFMLRGRSNAKLGNFEQAAVSFNRALAGEPSPRQENDILFDLAAAQVELKQYAKALSALRRIRPDGLAPQQLSRYMTMHAGVYRSMGLADRAAEILTSELPGITDASVRTDMQLELARCLLEASQNEDARQLLTELISNLKPGANSYEASCLLAELCMKEDKLEQAISLSRDLLASACGEPYRKRATSTMAAAYLKKNNYQAAAVALAGAGSSGKEAGK